MDRDKIAHAMPVIRLEFEALKDSLREGRLAAATSALFGSCLNWGEELRRILAQEGRAALSARDPLTRFFVTRTRGASEPAEIGQIPAAVRFLMAFTAFPYLDALMDEMSIGDHLGVDEDGNWLVGRVVAGLCDGSRIKVDKGLGGWRFDLMAIYQAKSQALETFIGERFDNDFDAFLWRYVAEHDLAFDMDRAWRPLEERGNDHAHPRA